MAGNQAGEHEIQERLDRMERELRRWRLGAVSLTVLVVAAGGLAEPAKRLSVQTLKLIDREGKERIVLTAEEGILDMTFLDPSGKSRLTLDITQDRIPVLLFSESGEEKNGLTLGFGEEEGPMLQFYDSKGKKRIAIAAPPNTTPCNKCADRHRFCRGGGTMLT